MRLHILSAVRPRRSARWQGDVLALAPLLMTGALLAGAFVSLAFLPYVAQESDFRVVRRVAGSDDAAVTGSYRYARRYDVYLRIGEHAPGAEFIISAEGSEGFYLLHFTAFASAGATCAADPATRLLVEQGETEQVFARAPSHLFRWSGDDASSASGHRIAAGADSDRYVVAVSEGRIDVVAVELLSTPVTQRCDDRG